MKRVITIPSSNTVVVEAKIVFKLTPQGQRVFVTKIFITKACFFATNFVATFKIATSRHKYSPHKYSSDDFLFPTNGCTH